VEEDKALHGDRVKPGDQLIGYASTDCTPTLHPCAQDHLRVDKLASTTVPETDQTVAGPLAVHRSYAARAPVLGEVIARHITDPGSGARFAAVRMPSSTPAVAVAAAVSCADAPAR